ncbi:MAG: hypothetical protein IJB98_02600 [Clostridia bacterium]|nr:hypothetical protein [Clostridia bacterium]
MENQIKLRKDINEIVKDIKFALEKGRYNTKKVCKVTLYNEDIISIDDKDDICSIISTYKKLGVGNCVKSATLVEEIQKEITDENKDPKYVCVLVVINDGEEDREFRLFPSSADKIRINMYYNAFQAKKKEKKVN